jgi:hypothetical protein
VECLEDQGPGAEEVANMTVQCGAALTIKAREEVHQEAVTIKAREEVHQEAVTVKAREEVHQEAAEEAHHKAVLSITKEEVHQEAAEEAHQEVARTHGGRKLTTRTQWAANSAVKWDQWSPNSNLFSKNACNHPQPTPNPK